MKKKYVKYYSYPCPYTYWTPKTDIREVNKSDCFAGIPTGTVALSFFDCNILTAEDGEILIGKEQNRSPIYYMGGDVYTRSQVEEKFPDGKMAMHNMGIYPDHLIRTPGGNWLPFNEGDVVLT